jgi:hypothetical protein
VPSERRERREPSRLRELWRNYGLSITLFTLFGLSFIGHTAAGWMQYSADQESHGQTPTVFGDSGYVWYWGEWTLQNWQSEFLELGVIVVLSSFLIHKGSAESKDSDDEIKELLTSIERKLDGLEAEARPDGRQDRESAKSKRESKPSRRSASRAPT